MMLALHKETEFDIGVDGDDGWDEDCHEEARKNDRHLAPIGHELAICERKELIIDVAHEESRRRGGGHGGLRGGLLELITNDFELLGNLGEKYVI